MPTINVNTTVYDLISSYPVIKDLMIELGFKDLKNPALLNTAGRYMTLKKGAKLKKIPLEKIIETLEKNGFTVIGGEDE